MPKIRKDIKGVSGQMLSFKHIRFIEEYLSHGDKARAYGTVYPEPQKTRKVLHTKAGQLLSRGEIRAEVQVRVQQSGATKPYIISKLMGIAEHKCPKYHDKRLVDREPHKESVNALREIAEIAEYHPDKSMLQLANFGNIVVKFPDGYSNKEEEKLGKVSESRIIE